MAVFQDVEKQFAGRAIDRHGLKLLRPADAAEYVTRCAEHGIEVLGIDGFCIDGESYELCIAEPVLAEAALGDPQAAQGRLDKLSTMTLLRTTVEAQSLAAALVDAGALPEKAAHDALHVAISAVNRIQYLLTWNCRHLANASMRPVIESVCAEKGFKAPIICTPEELLEAKK